MPRQTLKQRSDGRYRVKYKGREFYGNTQSEALEKREVFKQELARGLRANALGITFLDYSSQWLPAYKANCADKTYNDYVRITIMPASGSVRFPSKRSQRPKFVCCSTRYPPKASPISINTA